MNEKYLVIGLIFAAILISGCTHLSNDTNTGEIEVPDSESPQLPAYELEEPEEEEFGVWWQEYKKPISLNCSSHPEFYRGAWASRLDEMRYYLVNAEKLRDAGFDTIMLGPDIVFDPETAEAKSLGDDMVIFYIQAFKNAGFRVILVPNPMHPNVDMGKGYEWEGPDPNAAYHRSYELIKKLDPVVIKWAHLAENYDADGFVPVNEPYKLVRDERDASHWLQEIQPEIRAAYNGNVIAMDTMKDLEHERGRSIPYPYNYTGYDIIFGGPPAGRKYIADWETMLALYIQTGNEHARRYDVDGFGLYEWGGYTGGVWFEPIPEELVLTQDEAGQILEAGVRQADGNVVASFPRISPGWVDIDTPAFVVLKNWYLSMGVAVTPLDGKNWEYEELIEIEKELAGADYEDIFMIEGPRP